MGCAQFQARKGIYLPFMYGYGSLYIEDYNNYNKLVLNIISFVEEITNYGNIDIDIDILINCYLLYIRNVI